MSRAHDTLVWFIVKSIPLVLLGVIAAAVWRRI